MDKNNKLKLMSEGNVSKSLFKLGFPMVISMLVIALYNVVDTYFVSSLGTQQTAAVTVAFPISLIFSGIGLTFGVGAGSYISRLLGKKDIKQAIGTASTAMFSSIIVGTIVMVIIFIFLTPLLKFMGATQTIMPFAKEYTVIFVISTIFSTANITAGNLAIAQGSSNITLTSMLSGAILNMILDPIFITYWNMGVRGAAIATLISQIITSIIYIYFFSGSKCYVKITPSKFTLSKEIYSEILKIGVSMLLLQFLSALSLSLISKSASHYGDEAVAAMGFVLRIVTLGVNVVFGYMKGFQPMAGFNYGAKNYPRLKETIKNCLTVTTVFCIIWTIITFIFANPILSLFSNDKTVLEIANIALKANTLLFFTFGFQFTYSTLYLSIGKAAAGGFMNICRQGIMFLPVILILPTLIELNGVIYAQAIADVLTTIITFYFAIKFHKELKNLLINNN